MSCDFESYYKSGSTKKHLDVFSVKLSSFSIDDLNFLYGMFAYFLELLF